MNIYIYIYTCMLYKRLACAFLWAGVAFFGLCQPDLNSFSFDFGFFSLWIVG